MNKPSKLSKAREILWLAIALMSLIIAVHGTINFPFAKIWYYYAFILISIVMYLIRRNQRVQNK